MNFFSNSGAEANEGEWGKIEGDINEQPDLAGYINKVVDEKMNGIKILTVS